MKTSNKGFSFIELIIGISVIVILGMIVSTSYDRYLDKSNNSLITSQINSTKNALLSIYSDSQKLPTPAGNIKIYNSDGSLGNDIKTSFGVSGYVSDTFLPKKYLGFLPKDPFLNQFYGYGIRNSYKQFEIAGVLKEFDERKSFVIGNRTGENGLFSLIKEYAGPGFVFDGSNKYFPYNPEALKLDAIINSFSGNLNVNGINIDTTPINLNEGDKIKISSGGYAEIYFGDGSRSILGDNNSESELIIANLTYKKDSNLFTDIKLALSLGNIWTKAAKLANDSTFEVYTTDLIATVKGTSFGVRKDTTNTTNITVSEGSIVEVKHISITNIDELVENIKKGSSVGNSFINSGGILTIDSNGKSFIDTSDGIVKGIDISGNYPTSATGSILSIPNEIKTKTINNLGTLNEGIVLMLDSLSSTGINIKLTPNLILGKYLFYATGSSVVSNYDGNFYNTGSVIDNSKNIIKIDLNKLGVNPSDVFYMKLCEEIEEKNCTRVANYTIPYNSTTFTKDVIKEFDVVSNDTSCPITSQKIGGECVENNLYGSGYKIVAYAPYDDNLNMYFDDNSFTSGTSSGNVYFSGGLNRGVVVGYSSGSTGSGNLMYDISNLDLSNNFAIEMGARGEALKRTDNIVHYLFCLGDLKLDKFNNNLVLKDISYTGSSISSGSLLNTLKNDNTFYKVIAKVEGGIGTLYIDGTDLIGTGAINININSGSLYIGSDNTSKFQWNDIIDYVKIYKLNN